MKLKSLLQKNNLLVFPCEYTHVYPKRYTWYICIAIIICTRLQDYLYPLIQRKSVPQTSLVIILHTHERTHAIVKVYMGPRPCRIESRQILGLSMKHACTCSTFHSSSLTLFCIRGNLSWFCSLLIFFQNQFVCCCFFF